MNNRVRSFSLLGYLCNSSIENQETTISLYKQGIQELEKALNVPVDPNGNKRETGQIDIHVSF